MRTRRCPRLGQPLAATIAAMALATPTACSGTDPQATTNTSQDQQTRTVSSLYGKVEVPADPQRVVTLNDHVLATALLVDAPVVGTDSPQFGDSYPPFLDEAKTESIEARVGTSSDLNIEEIARLEPDLIIGDDDFVEEPYDQLTAVAPTVALDIGGGPPWKQQVRDIAKVLGRAAAAEEAIAAFEKRVKDFRAAAAPNVEGLEFSLINVRALDDIRIYTSGWCSGQILEEAGLSRPPSQHVPGESSVQLSIERLPEVDADVLFYFVGSSGTNPEEAQAAADQITTHPLWSKLGAVPAGRAHQVNAEWWFNCGSAQAANLVLDDMYKVLG